MSELVALAIGGLCGVLLERMTGVYGLAFAWVAEWRRRRAARRESRA